MTARAAILGVALACAALAGWVPEALAQTTGAPRPIAAPPIPPPPRLAPVPTLKPAGPASAPHPKIDVPAPPSLAPVTAPAPREKTPANPADPIPPPRIGADAPRPAAASPGATAAAIEKITLILPSGAIAIMESDQPKIARVLDALKGAPDARLEVRAYSPQTSPTDSKARRLSLSRFLAIRDYLVKNGVADSRIDARALGSTGGGADADRIELFIER